MSRFELLPAYQYRQASEPERWRRAGSSSRQASRVAFVLVPVPSVRTVVYLSHLRQL
jgi:hypothetical protein